MRFWWKDNEDFGGMIMMWMRVEMMMKMSRSGRGNGVNNTKYVMKMVLIKYF